MVTRIINSHSNTISVQIYSRIVKPNSCKHTQMFIKHISTITQNPPKLETLLNSCNFTQNTKKNTFLSTFSTYKMLLCVFVMFRILGKF